MHTMISQFKPKNARLPAEKLDAMSAISRWLTGDIRRGEDRGLCEAIRRGIGISLSDDTILRIMTQARSRRPR